MSLQPPRFNPYATENHYGLEFACALLYQQQVRSVYISTPDADIAQAVCRRLADGSRQLAVDNKPLALEIQAHMRIPLEPEMTAVQADAALVPFSRKHYRRPPQSPIVVVLARNSLSYSSLRPPYAVDDNVVQVVAWMRQTHAISMRIGLMGPRFITTRVLAALAGPRFPTYHFKLEQAAMDHLSSRGPLSWLGCVVILMGRLRAA